MNKEIVSFNFGYLSRKLFYNSSWPIPKYTTIFGFTTYPKAFDRSKKNIILFKENMLNVSQLGI